MKGKRSQRRGERPGRVLSKREQSLLDVLEARAEGRGVEIVSLEIVGAKKAPTIRVYIDTDHGVSFDELSSAQAWINDVMDELDPFPGAYMLEVSSPGIDRPLRTPQHFARFVGERAVIKTTGPIDGRSTFTGTLTAMNEDAGTVDIDCDGQAYSITLDSMKKANLKGEIDFGS